MHETAEAFDYPLTNIKVFKKWTLLVRRSQITFGSMVLMVNDDIRRFTDLSSDHVSELEEIYDYIENVLFRKLGYDKINYLALMMRDPQVHYHVIPRYEEPKFFKELQFIDHGWPKLPDFGKSINLTDEQVTNLVNFLQS
jgi:diadenosine tetraphosphate (Ap4A) HIT family hydrolase